MSFCCWPLKPVQLLLEQVALGAQDAQLALRIGQRLLQGGELFGRGHANHRRALSWRDRVAPP
jgi:hypothetical protein